MVTQATRSFCKDQSCGCDTSTTTRACSLPCITIPCCWRNLDPTRLSRGPNNRTAAASCVSGIPVDRGCCKLCSATWLQIGQVPNKKVSSTTGAILENKIVLLCIIDIAILIYTYSNYYVFGVWGALLMPFLGVDLLMAGDRWEPMARKWVESSREQRNLGLCGIYVYIYIIVLVRGIIPK